jgi:hypothetical protein
LPGSYVAKLHLSASETGILDLVSVPSGNANQDSRSWLTRWLPLIINVLVTFGLYEVYELTRGLLPRNGPLAIQHAHEVWDWEVHHGLFVEPEWQQYWLKSGHILGWLWISPEEITDFLNTGYLYVHFIGTISFLIWLYLFRRSIFGFVRNVFFVSTGVSLLMYVLYPLAPPRLAPNLFYDNRHYTFIDTVKKVLGSVSNASEIGYNPYAAMPSLHFGWALIIGGTLFLTLRFWPLRLLGLCYPLFMLCVIVVSGNHFFADAIGSTAVVAFAVAVNIAWAAFKRRMWTRPSLLAPPTLGVGEGVA